MAVWSHVCAHVKSTISKQEVQFGHWNHAEPNSIQHPTFLFLWNSSLCTGFSDGSSSLCCGVHSWANSPSVCSNIGRPLDMWLTQIVFLGSKGSEDIAHSRQNAKLQNKAPGYLSSQQTDTEDGVILTLENQYVFLKKTIQYLMLQTRHFPLHGCQRFSFNRPHTGYKWASFGTITTEIHIWLLVKLAFGLPERH